MKYKCVIVDDEELARDLIENHLGQLDDFEIVASCASAIEASKVLQQQTVDLLFLDIQMPVLKGTDFFRNLVNKPKVIFTTAYRDYAMDGFDLNAVDYLLKPITFGRFFKSIEKFLSLQPVQQTYQPVAQEVHKKDEFIFIKEDRKQVKVYLDDILYIESVKDYIKIVTSKKRHLVKYTITAFQDNLSDQFLRIHRSYIVNSSRITAYTKHDVEIDDHEIPIGESYKNSIIDRLKNS